MTDKLNFPPRRELPPEVRERMRAELDRGMSGRPQLTRVLAVAAAVVVFAVGAVVLTQVDRSPHSSSAPVAHVPSAGWFDRCWAAVLRSGKTADVPDVSTWVKVALASQGADSVLSFTADGKPVFCETTTTTVTLSNPNARPVYPPGTNTTLLLHTGTGLVAGLGDPTWPGVELELADGLGVSTANPVGPQRQFTSFTGLAPDQDQLFARSYTPGKPLTGPHAELPPAPAPLFSIVDRPGSTTSPAGKALETCLNAVPDAPADRDAYVPGAMLTDGRYQVVLGQAPGHALACVTEPDPANPATLRHQLYLDTFIGQSIPVRRLSVPGLGPDGTKVPFVGTVPPASVSMIADFGIGGPTDIPVANGTFAVWLPAGAKSIDNGQSWVEPKDANGVSTFNGYIPTK